MPYPSTGRLTTFALPPARPPTQAPTQLARVPAPPCHLPALPRFEPASPDPLRYLRDTIPFEPVRYHAIQQPRKVTATLVGRYPPPCPGPPLQSRQACNLPGSRYIPKPHPSNKPPRGIVLSAPSFFALSCLVLPCHPRPRRRDRIQYRYSPVSQFCHVRHNVLFLCTAHIHLFLPLLHLGSSPHQTVSQGSPSQTCAIDRQSKVNRFQLYYR